MKNLGKIFVGLFLFFSFFVYSQAEGEIPENLQTTLTLKHNFYTTTLNLANHQDFFIKKQKISMRGQEIVLAEDLFCPEQEKEIILPEGAELKEDWALDTDKVATYLEENIAPTWNKTREDVRIYKDEEGKIQFNGVGTFGETLKTKSSAEIIEKAVLNDVSFVTLDFDTEQPAVTVDDPDLQALGIKDLITIGESDFSGSPYNRIQNITIGAGKFNGALIPQGEIFSFNDTLGEVSARTGYLQELVIKGDMTVPDYGGGLCQVSTTTFRAALLAGLDIVERWPHAYAVTYYEPWGSDATIYIGGKNLRFKNDTNGAILIQTNIKENHLYFHFYGTHDQREVALYGPYIGGWQAALPTRTKYTADLAPGETKVVSGAHVGLNATWVQFVRLSTDSEKTERLKTFFSRFEPRGLFYLVGGSGEEAAAVEEGENSEG